MNLGNQNKIIFIIVVATLIFLTKLLYAETIKGHLVTIGALDKITAKFSEFDIKVGNKKNFGTLEINIFKCKKRPPEEIPENFVLLKITDEINIDKPVIFFSGWMLSSSPSLSPLEHPTYDIWVKDCKVL